MKPPALKPGDTIGVMAPSSYVEKDDIEKSKAVLEAKGFKVFIHPQTYERHGQFAGTDLQKSLALQGLWQRADINAIWAAGGGNRALNLIDHLNYDAIKQKPKIFIGFSDVTAIINAIYAQTGLTTFHGPVFKNLHKQKQNLDHTLNLLMGQKPVFDLTGASIIHPGSAEGILVGGNLSTFIYLPHTLPGTFWKDSILFLEDCGDELSRFDRMFIHLKRTGVLKSVRALVLGEFLDVSDTGRPFGFSLAELVKEHMGDSTAPILINAPFGHGSSLPCFPVGTNARMETDSLQIILDQPAVLA
jgi:muramoyltetrapeptide carboxypeptidase